MPMLDCFAPRTLDALVSALRHPHDDNDIACSATMLRDLVALVADVTDGRYDDSPTGFPWRAVAGDSLDVLLRDCEKRAQGR